MNFQPGGAIFLSNSSVFVHISFKERQFITKERKQAKIVPVIFRHKSLVELCSVKRLLKIQSFPRRHLVPSVLYTWERGWGLGRGLGSKDFRVPCVIAGSYSPYNQFHHIEVLVTADDIKPRGIKHVFM